MDNKKFEFYLNKIGEWVIDESKILTYKSLSKNFGVHVNTAKQLLHSYLRRQKNDEKFPIFATYLVVGKFADGTLSFTIVNEKDLKITCSKYLEITSKHIYSIQAAEKVKEVKVLCDNDKEKRKTETIIKFSKNILKNKTILRQESKVSRKEEKVINSACKDVEVKQNNIFSSNLKCENLLEKNSETVSKSPKKPVTLQNKKNVEKKFENEKSKEKDKKSKGNIVNFFANSTHKNQPSQVAVELNDFSKDKNTNVKVSSFENKEKEKNKNTSKVKKNSPVKSIKKREYSDRQKRKRIQIFSDSENSSSSNEEDVEENINIDEENYFSNPSLLLEEENKIESNCTNKRKKRKIVDVTVMSEDGYLETKKEIVYGTDSEEENEIKSESLKSDISNPKKVKMEDKEKEKEFNISRAPKKQSSLLTFFKKN